MSAIAPFAASSFAPEERPQHTAGSPDGGRALGLLGRVAVLRALL
jgi:hypothetical protein